ncbi:MAG: aspartate-semialdehyde dehydrogenase [Thioalkalispiraceae bacterium]|jgi:aspartate-semialdehyde dehydrogenase
MNKPVAIAVAGATSLVGEALIELLTEHQFPVAEFYPLEHEDEAGGRVTFNQQAHQVADINHFDFSKAQLVFFCGDTALSETYVPKAAEAGCRVIDRSAAFRHVQQVPLVVDGVNSEQIRDNRIICSPCCVSLQLAKILKPLQDSFGLDSVTVSTYQAVSGAGKAGLEEVGLQTAALLNFKEMKTRVFPHQIAFNVIPQIGSFEESGYTREEMKVINETRRVLASDAVHIDATTVRVPVFYGHSISLSLLTQQAVSRQQAQALLNKLDAVEVTDSDDMNDFPTPVSDAVGQEQIYVGRIRNHIDNEKGLSLWITADNIRACGAYNLLKIAQSVIS